MPWVLRGLRDGVVSTRYPRRPDGYADSFPAGVRTCADHIDVAAQLVGAVCPTGAIEVDDVGRVSLDRGRCILCGACVRAYPQTFDWSYGSEVSALDRTALTVPAGTAAADSDVASMRAALAARVHRLRRSVHIRHVDAGSDGAEEWEIQALTNPTYDVHRLGIFFTASPRHADILMVTGAGARAMLPALARTRIGMPDPVVVMAVGTDAISGGLVGRTYATTGGVLDALPADVLVPGSPPPPFAILHGILLALGRVPERAS